MHLIWLTNIPTPYRNLRYRTFVRIFPQYNISFEVAYMAASEPGRHWQLSERDLDHPHKIYPGVHVRTRGFTAHMNPGIPFDVRRKRPDMLVVGGYSSPTLILAAKAARAETTVLLAAESTIEDGGRSSGPVARIKRRMVERAAGYIGPGVRARDYVHSLSPAAASKPFFRLPNIVDGRVFRDDVSRAGGEANGLRARQGVANRTQLWFLPARLEPYKGLDALLPLLGGLTGYHLFIAGDGSQQRECPGIYLPMRCQLRCSEACLSVRW